MRTLSLITSIACFSVIISCASSDKKTSAKEDHTSTSVEAQQVAAENEAAAVAEIQFVKGKTTLTKEAQSRLRELIKNTPSTKAIDNVKVISWADHEYPSVHTVELSKEQRKIADARIEAISSFLKKNGQNATIEKFNMAERPNALESFFETEDASIKKSLETLGIPNTDTSVKSPGKSSKAIVMVVLKR